MPLNSGEDTLSSKQPFQMSFLKKMFVSLSARLFWKYRRTRLRSNVLVFSFCLFPLFFPLFFCKCRSSRSTGTSRSPWNFWRKRRKRTSWTQRRYRENRFYVAHDQTIFQPNNEAWLKNCMRLLFSLNKRSRKWRMIEWLIIQIVAEQVTRGHNIVADGWAGASNLP